MKMVEIRPFGFDRSAIWLNEFEILNKFFCLTVDRIKKVLIYGRIPKFYK